MKEESAIRGKGQIFFIISKFQSLSIAEKLVISPTLKMKLQGLLMNRVSRNFFLLLVAILQSFSIVAQADHHHDHDTTHQELSPHFMPVSYTNIEPHYFAPLIYTDVDTSLIYSHYSNDILRVENLYQTLGISGQAHQTINFDYHHDRGFTYINYPYPLLMMQQKDIQYYDLKTTFTRLSYTFGLGKESIFDAIHTQKIRQVNFGFNLKAFSNPGYFVNQAASYLIGNAFIHYELPSKIYGFRVAYIFNRLKYQENSGLVDGRLDSTTVYDYQAFLRNEADAYSNYVFNTEKATSLTTSHDVLLQQYVNLRFKEDGFSLGYLNHSFQYKTYKSKYLDPALDTNRYKELYFSKDTTADSLQYYHIINTLQWSTFNPYHRVEDKKNFIHVAAGITHEYMEDRIRRRPFSENIYNKTLDEDSLPKYSSNSFTLFGRTYIRLLSVMDISGAISYTFNGYNNNDAMANATVSWAINRKNEHHLGFTGNFYRVNPDYIYTYYSGNQLRWENELPKQNILQLAAFWCRKQIRFDFNYFYLNKYAYFNQELKPTTLEEPANILQLHFSSPVRIKNFGFNTNLYLQHSDNDIIQVPLFAGKASIYYIFNLFKRKMQIQVQTDLMYNTIYQANGYSPMLRQFYIQENFEVGNFLYLDANLNVRVDRLSFFFRIYNVLAGVLGNNYFTTPYYPMDRFYYKKEGVRFQIGINWRFYD